MIGLIVGLPLPALPTVAEVAWLPGMSRADTFLDGLAVGLLLMDRAAILSSFSVSAFGQSS